MKTFGLNFYLIYFISNNSQNASQTLAFHLSHSQTKINKQEKPGKITNQNQTKWKNRHTLFVKQTY